MLNNTLLDTLDSITLQPPEPVLRKIYFFHNVRITCQTNHPAILAILDAMLGIFPNAGPVQAEATYSVFCYDHASQFPVRLPHDRKRIQSMQLLTNTTLKYYLSSDYTTEYHSYAAMPPVNEAALSVINPARNIALTQIKKPEQYEANFLRRYVLLIALGHLMRHYGFEPCHAAAITAPWDNQQGALIIGTTGSGKTTLSLGCANIGCGLLGDDLVMLRKEACLINAYAITHEISVRSGSLELWPSLSFLRAFPADARDKRYCAIEQVRAGTTRIQTPIRLLIFPSLTTAARSTLAPLSKANTLQALLDQCLSKKSTYPHGQEQLFSLLCNLVEQARGYRLTIAQGATDGPQIVRSLFTGDPDE